MRGLRATLVVLVAAAAGGCAVAPGPDPFALRAEADGAYRRGDWAAAERGYRALADRVPEDAYAFFRLGNALARQQQFEEALRAWREALIREPGMGKAYSNMAALYLLQARLALEEALRRLPRDSAAAAQASRRLEALRRLTRTQLGRGGPPPQPRQ